MRRILAIAAAACLFGGFALPASAASGSGPPPIPTCVPGAGPCQETDHFSQMPFIGAPLNCPASAPSYFSGFVSIDATGNGIQHINVNQAQDFWVTTTFTGAATITPILVTVIPNPPPQPPTIIVLGRDPSRPVLTGHIQIWFGLQVNNKNQVTSDTGNVQASAPDGTMYTAHFNDHLNSVPANPFVPHTIVMHTTCR